MTTPRGACRRARRRRVPQALLVQGGQDKPCRIAALLAQPRRKAPGMQADLLAAVSAFLKHSNRAVDGFNKANSLIAPQALPLPLQSRSRLGEIAREGIAKGGDLPGRTERLRGRGRIKLFACAFNHLGL